MLGLLSITMSVSNDLMGGTEEDARHCQGGEALKCRSFKSPQPCWRCELLFWSSRHDHSPHGCADVLPQLRATIDLHPFDRLPGDRPVQQSHVTTCGSYVSGSSVSWT